MPPDVVQAYLDVDEEPATQILRQGEREALLPRAVLTALALLAVIAAAVLPRLL